LRNIQLLCAVTQAVRLQIGAGEVGVILLLMNENGTKDAERQKAAPPGAARSLMNTLNRFWEK